MPERTFVVVGGGLAAGTAAHELRERGFAGRLVVLAAEPHRPYERPPLSKQVLAGTAADDSVFVDPLSWYAEHDVDLRVGTVVDTLDLAGRRVLLADGTGIPYDAVVLATGARARTLPAPGADLAGVVTLRTLDDALALRARLADGDPVVIVGAGWIGLEVAAAARGAGCAVTVVEVDSAPLRRVVGDEVAEIFRRLHADRGVQFRFGERVERLVGGADGAVAAVETSAGVRVPAATVVVGIGAEPVTDVADRAGLAVGDGVRVDALLRTSAPQVYAVGDVALAEHPRLGRPVRVEHWATALRHGRAVAATLLGAGRPFTREPYFFTDQYTLSMEMTGHLEPGGYDEVVFRGDPAGPQFVAFWLAGARVQAGMNVNAWDLADPIEALVASQREVDRARLADPEVPLDVL